MAFSKDCSSCEVLAKFWCKQFLQTVCISSQLLCWAQLFLPCLPIKAQWIAVIRSKLLESVKDSYKWDYKPSSGSISITVYHLDKYVNIFTSAVHLLQVWHSCKTDWFDRRTFMQNFWIQAFSVRKSHLTSLGQSGTCVWKRNSPPKKGEIFSPW